MHALQAEEPTHTILSTYNHHSMALVKLKLTCIAKTSAMHLYWVISLLFLAAFQTINHYYTFFFFLKCSTRPISFTFINKKLLYKKFIKSKPFIFPKLQKWLLNSSKLPCVL